MADSYLSSAIETPTTSERPEGCEDEKGSTARVYAPLRPGPGDAANGGLCCSTQDSTLRRRAADG